MVAFVLAIPTIAILVGMVAVLVPRVIEVLSEMPLALWRLGLAASDYVSVPNQAAVVVGILVGLPPAWLVYRRVERKPTKRPGTALAALGALYAVVSIWGLRALGAVLNDVQYVSEGVASLLVIAVLIASITAVFGSLSAAITGVLRTDSRARSRADPVQPDAA